MAATDSLPAGRLTVSPSGTPPARVDPLDDWALDDFDFEFDEDFEDEDEAL
jgi:hypothetical protein